MTMSTRKSSDFNETDPVLKSDSDPIAVAYQND